MLCSGERFLLADLVVGCVFQGLRERLLVWNGNSMMEFPIRGVVSLYGGEVVEGEGVLGDLVLILGGVCPTRLHLICPRYLFQGLLEVCQGMVVFWLLVE